MSMAPNQTFNWTAKAAQFAVHSLRSLLHGAPLRFSRLLIRRWASGI